MELQAIRALFPGVAQVAYLNTANQALGPRPAREAHAQALAQWTAGSFDWTEAERAGEAARGLFAELIGAFADEIAIAPAVSTMAGLIASNLPDARTGENVVVGAGEFSSNYFPWLMLRERGYEVRTIATPDGAASVDAFAAAADRNTRLIAVSAVHSATGFRADLAGIVSVAARSGAWTFVDAAQAAGAIPLDVRTLGVDFLAVPSHKYLLGTRGMGYLYIRQALRDRLRPLFPGWKAGRVPAESFYGPTMELSTSASRFDTSLPWFAALGDAASLGIFWRFGADALLERTARLSEVLHETLSRHFPEFRPHPEAHRSQIASVPVREAVAVVARLKAEGVIVSARDGRVRLSVNFYNTEDEIERAAKSLVV